MRSEGARRVLPACALFLVWLVAGCGAPGTVHVSVEAFNRAQGPVRLNYEAYSPRRLADVATIVVRGRVMSVEDGDVHDDGVFLRHVMVGVQPTDVVEDDTDRVGDVVRVEIGRRDDDGSLEEMRDALPEGTHVVLFGTRVDGSSAYAPLPQGWWFETEDGLENVLTTPDTGPWPDIDSWEELKAAANL